MKRFLSILGILASTLSAFGFGANDGTSWDDAWTNFASVTWTRGDTYYIAGGTYVEDVVISASESGSTWITLKKANAADNGSDAGWDSSFGTEQAVISGRVSVSNGYVEIDGVTGSGTSGHGIKIYRTDVDTGLNSCVDFSHSTGSPWHLYHLEIGGPGYSYWCTGGDGIYWNSASASSKGVHINYVWLHEIPRNGVTFGELGGGTSFADYSALIENSVFERTGGVGEWHANIHGQTFQAGYLATLQYVTWRNNVFKNCTGQAFLSFLGTSVNNYIRIYNNVFMTEWPDSTVYGRATSGDATRISQGVNSVLGETPLARSFSTYEGLVGRTLTNITQGATGIITSYSGSNILMSAGMSGGVVNAEGDLFKFPCNGRSAYHLASSIYTTAGNTVNYFQILNNTFYNLNLANVAVWTPVGNVGNVAQNNLFMSNYFSTMAACPTITAHGYWANADGSYDPANTETADPFVDSATYNFNLKSTALSIGGGVDLSAIFTTDFAGGYRSVPFDIGAYEFPGMLGWWKFDEGTGTTAADSSGAGLDGTLTSGPTWVTGKVGPYAVDFDGVNDVVLVPYDASWNFTGDFTVTAWVYSTQDARKSAVGRWRSDLWNGWTLEQITPTRFDFEYQDRMIYGEGSHRSIGSGLGYTTATWHHVAGVKSGNYVYVFVDGVVGTTSTEIVNDIGLTTEGIAIGARKSTLPDAFWKGDIDDVRIYNRALTQAEILALYNGSPAGTVPHGSFRKLVFRGKSKL